MRTVQLFGICELPYQEKTCSANILNERGRVQPTSVAGEDELNSVAGQDRTCSANVLRKRRRVQQTYVAGEDVFSELL
jgi:hypothetical protein